MPIARSRFGTLAGSLHGRSWIPTRWYDNIENGPGGRDQIVQVARRLASLSCGSD
ncbi:MAG: hypothetical protein RBS80_01790 [Thermoguttaceae bacterium]|nr:hypothetical protein [Thermoguttaceae bacterium]